jgi:nitrogen regulatory protein PII-like uncharacterized protein|tara:strand:+ start:6016 stop:6306 length:291 start_codon:yes stop_codon:yes gene_type:complete
MIMKTFNVIMDVKIPEGKYEEVESWGSSPKEYIISVIKDHAQERGMIVNIVAEEVDHPLMTRLSENRDAIMRQDALNDLEEEVLNAKMCIGGTCED